METLPYQRKGRNDQASLATMYISVNRDSLYLVYRDSLNTKYV